MLYVHENNLLNKIRTNYGGKALQITDFYHREYLPVKEALSAISFCEENPDAFPQAANIINAYYSKLEQFSREYAISSQSKFASTFLEEISTYLFQQLPEIVSGEFRT